MSTDLDIRSMEFTEAWNMLKTEISMNEATYKKVRFGITIKFDINDYIKGRITIKSKTGKAFIRGEAYELDEFETELEHREREMKNWLLENMTQEEIATPRGIE